MVDDHRLFLDGMSQLLERLSGQVDVVCAEGGVEALESLEADDSFDLILLDLAIPGIDGHSFLHAIAARRVPIPAVIISASDDPYDITRAMEAGAFGFVRKSAPAEEMLSALQQVLSGSIYLPADYQPPESRPKAVADKELTSRQLVVLKLLGAGHPNKRIATILQLSEETVKSHLRVLFMC